MIDHVLAERLADVVGHEYVLAGAEAADVYTVQGVRPGCVVAPGSLDELSAVLRLAHEQQAVVVPWGGGTAQALGFPPERADVVVRTSRLNRVLIHEPDDLTISVEAGITLAALTAHLSQYGQMLPVDAPLPARATIGGMIATAADGPRRTGYGSLRDLLIGVTVVEATGRVSRGGGMVVKNVSGFDMMKLYLGSFGTLALIAVANFKLWPAPRERASLLCRFAQPADAFAFLDALQATQLTPVSAEYLNAGALAMLDLGDSCAVAVGAEGLPGAVARHVADVRSLAAGHAATAVDPVGVEVWGRVADLSQTASLAPDEAVLKLTMLPADLARAVAALEDRAARAGQQLAISARAYNGVAYARVRPIDAHGLDQLAGALPGVQWVASATPGGPRWGRPGGFELMRRIKHEFDPQRILNRGRFIERL